VPSVLVAIGDRYWFRRRDHLSVLPTARLRVEGHVNSDAPIFLGYAHPSGKLDLDFLPQFKARVRELAGESGAEVEIVITASGENKTRRQEKGFHAMVRPWARKRGERVDYLKQWLLSEIFGTHRFAVPGTDTYIEVLAEPHTSKLTRRQYCELIEGAMQIASEKDGFYLIAPDEYRKAKEAAAKQLAREAKRAAETKCDRCKKPCAPSALVVKEVPWSDGGQSGTEEIEVCPTCAQQIDREAA
jgi:hypothetical protein